MADRNIPPGTVVTASLVNKIGLPRTRGEDRDARGRSRRADGLPPHPRGRLPITEVLEIITRFTPAPAGKTDAQASSQRQRAVYPRTRGEDTQFCLTKHSCAGLPPHPRGRRLRISDILFSNGFPPHPRGRPIKEHIPRFFYRFTPAPAGKTMSPEEKKDLLPVYPRTRLSLDHISSSSSFARR